MSKSTNPLRKLNAAGQSVWCDHIHRGMLETGGLAAMIEDDDLHGITSNPSIFDKAISGSHEYDALLQRELRAHPGQSSRDLFFALAIEDIRDGADVLRPVYEEELHELSAVHRDTLKIVPGFGGGPAPDRLLVPRQEGPELRHMACEVSSAPCSTGSRRGYPQPAAAYAAAGRTGRHIPTICGWEAHDELACAGQR